MLKKIIAWLKKIGILKTGKDVEQNNLE